MLASISGALAAPFSLSRLRCSRFSSFSLCRSLRCCSFWRFLKVCGPRPGIESLRWFETLPARETGGVRGQCQVSMEFQKRHVTVSRQLIPKRVEPLTGGPPHASREATRALSVTLTGARRIGGAQLAGCFKVPLPDPFRASICLRSSWTRARCRLRCARIRKKRAVSPHIFDI